MAFITGGRKRLHSKQSSRELTWRTEGTCERQTAPAVGRSPAFNCSSCFWAIWWLTNNGQGHSVVMMEQDKHRTFCHHAWAATENTVWIPTKHLHFLAYTCDFQFIVEKPSIQRGSSVKLITAWEELLAEEQHSSQCKRGSVQGPWTETL